MRGHFVWILCADGVWCA